MTAKKLLAMIGALIAGGLGIVLIAGTQAAHAGVHYLILLIQLFPMHNSYVIILSSIGLFYCRRKFEVWTTVKVVQQWDSQRLAINGIELANGANRIGCNGGSRGIGGAGKNQTDWKLISQPVSPST